MATCFSLLPFRLPSSPSSSSAMATMSLQHPYKLHPHAALLDGAIASQEWAMYTELDPKSEYGEVRIPPQRQDQLTRATKDLMSLDSNSLRWNESADRHTANSSSSASSSTSTSNSTSSGLTLNTSFVHQPSVLSHASPLHRFSSPQSPIVFNGSLAALHRPLTVTPNSTIDARSSTSQGSDPSPSPPMPPVGKRPSHLSIATDGASSSSSSRQPAASKKRRTSPSSASAVMSNGTASAYQSPGGAAKPALLSPSQKKANHIQSEQKRRANIRRGYDALCETVPALREAIQKEEEDMAALTAAAAAATAQEDKNGKGKARKKNRGKKGAGGSLDAAEKVDGRAGPKSENVVLQKTIDYIHELLEEKATLLGRMHRARSYLPPGHPALAPLLDQPLWEREWTGGLGILDDVDGDGADSDEEEAES